MTDHSPPSKINKSNPNLGFNNYVNRRTMLGLIAGGLSSSLISYHDNQFGIEQLYAQTPNNSDSRLLLIIPQGGLDGLAFLSPYGDPNYKRLRAKLALVDGVGDSLGHPIDKLFAMHPAVAPSLMDSWLDKDLLFFPTIASPYRGESHVDARMVMQNGGTAPTDYTSGWLGRALAEMGPTLSNPIQPDITSLDQERRQIISQQGQLQQIQNFLPYDHRVMQSMQYDPELLASMQLLLNFEGERRGMFSNNHDVGVVNVMDSQAMITFTERAANVLRLPRGPRVAIIVAHGFDTHIQQGILQGPLASNMAALAESIRRARNILTPVWENSQILVFSEFGRAIRPNNTDGTEHGLAGLAMLLGGKVDGGKVIGPWPGLSASDKNDNNRLTPTIDSRALFKAVLTELWQFSRPTIDQIFPNTQNIPPLSNLYRS